MPLSSWKEPFLRLREKIADLYYHDVEIYHRIIASCVERPLLHASVKDHLSLEIPCETLRRQVSIQTPGLAAHSHLFYAHDLGSVERFAQILEGLDYFASQIPSTVVPPVRLPDSDQVSRNLAHWMSLVYTMAWKADAIYLPAGVDCMITHNDEEMHSWSSLRKPQNADPRPWLIHCENDEGGPQLLQSTFDSQQLVFPEIIFGYLERDVVQSSAAAVDLLIHMLRNENADLSKPKAPSRQIRNPRRRRREMVWMLIEVLRDHHDYARHGERARALAKQRELANELRWSQAKVHRIMADVFGKHPMNGYRACWFRAGMRGLEEAFKNALVPPKDPAPLHGNNSA